ncbi:hypothetical protein [Aquibium sp. ELW1220]|uniref:hypothetical protein n=1 Tax=Aquibium sp. ELW1220 TaxID=2976766 RepID=UPI0025AFDF50|nr:hypothetical protein [Aquibium sp. ELW1220]MDN2580149.1 hypothetical protein [Aquibium sp. ELW1220]
MRPFWFPIALLLALSMASGCTQSMLATVSADDVAHGVCTVNAGAYHLPKRVVEVTVTAAPATVAPKRFDLTVTEPKRIVADSSETFCLDFLFSHFAEDRIAVERTPTGLLQQVYTRADDKSRPIAEAVIRATGDLVAASAANELANLRRDAAAQVKEAQTLIFLKIEVDPFVESEMKALNAALREFGYCVYVDNRDDPFVPDWAPSVCNAPTWVKDPIPADAYATEFGNARQLMQRGVLYRPEISHRLKVMRKRDPGNPREAWHLAGTEYITMPNRAPIFALGVNRALFVKAETRVKFQAGIIDSVAVDKPSELNAAVEIPLYAARVALSIPAATLSIFQNEAANRRALWQTNAELIRTLEQMRRTTTLDQAVAAGQIPAAARAMEIDVALPIEGGGGRAANLPPPLQRLSNCLEDDAINGTPEGRRECLEIMAEGE